MNDYGDNGRGIRASTLMAFALYMAVLIGLTFAPFGRGLDLGDRLNLDPFATIERAFELGPRSLSFRLMIANIVAFVPLGILLPILFRRWTLAIVLVGAVGLSAAIEVGQLAVSTWLGFAYRSTDIDDVILNSLGALIGYGGFAAVRTVGALQPDR